MGWGLRKHTHFFTDCSTGCVFGPMKSDAIDLHRKFAHGGFWLDEKNVRLCDLLRVPGCELEYMYDLGDAWVHLVQLESAIFNKDSASEGPMVLEGKYNCPPEDSTQEYLHSFYNIRGANNPKGAARTAKQTVGITNFDALHFDVDERNAAVEKALRETGDDGTGHYVRMFGVGSNKFSSVADEQIDDAAVDTELEQIRASYPGRNVTRQKDGGIDIHGHGSIEAGDSVCATCGCAHGPKQAPLIACIRCQKLHYCSVQCALADQKRHKSEEGCAGHNWTEAFLRQGKSLHTEHTAAVEEPHSLEAKLQALQQQHEALQKSQSQPQGQSHSTACLICNEFTRCWAAEPCGHTVLCDSCRKARQTSKATDTLKVCPVCQCAVQGWQKVYV